MAFPQPPSVGDKSGITAAASFSQSESQTNKDAQQLQWKDDTHEGIRSETSFTCNSEGREEMVLKPRSNTYNTDELENMTMQISHGSGPSSSNAVEKGIAEKQAHLTLGLGQSVFCNEERIEKDEARRLVGEHAAAAALRGRMDSQQWCRGSVNQDGVAKEDDAASDRSIDNASSGAGLPPFETEVRMMNEDGNPAITTDQDVSKHCTSMKDVVRDTSDIGMLSSVAPRRRLQETLAQLEWWIDEWQRKKEIYQQDKVHLEVCGPPTFAQCFYVPLTLMACCCYYLHRIFMISLKTQREMPSRPLYWLLQQRSHVTLNGALQLLYHVLRTTG